MITVKWIKITWIMPAAVLCFLVWTVAGGSAAEGPVVPVVDGHLGGCSAEFTVTDANLDPVYDAKIDVSFRHGFLGLRKLSLQVGTNSEGRARVAGLPDNPDKTYQFRISSGKISKTVAMSTSDGCDAVFKVALDKE